MNVKLDRKAVVKKIEKLGLLLIGFSFRKLENDRAWDLPRSFLHYTYAAFKNHCIFWEIIYLDFIVFSKFFTKIQLFYENKQG